MGAIPLPDGSNAADMIRRLRAIDAEFFGTLYANAGIIGGDVTILGTATIGDILSTDWDGADPVDLSTVDAVASAGYALDTDQGAMQLMGDLFLGGSLTLEGGLIRTAASGQRIELDSTNINQINFYSGHANEDEAGTISVNTVEPFSLYMGSPVPVNVGRNASFIQLKSDDAGSTVESTITFGTDLIYGEQMRIGTVTGYPELQSANAVGTPGYSFIGDLDTGMYRQGTNVLGMVAGGSDSVLFTASAALNSNFGSVSTPAWSWQSDQNTGLYRSAADVAAMTAGGVLHQLWDNGNNAVNVVNNGLGVGFSGTLLTSGYMYNIPPTSGSAANTLWVLASGSIYYLNRSTSSRRYKKKIRDWATTSWIFGLRPVSFKGSAAEPQHNEQGEPIRDKDGEPTYKRKWNKERSFGLIAEEVYEQFPAAVILDGDGKPEGIDWNVITVALVAEVQQLRERIEVLENA